MPITGDDLHIRLAGRVTEPTHLDRLRSVRSHLAAALAELESDTESRTGFVAYQIGLMVLDWRGDLSTLDGLIVAALGARGGDRG